VERVYWILRDWLITARLAPGEFFRSRICRALPDQPHTGA